MIIKTRRKGDILYITLEDTKKGKLYKQTYTCSLDEARIKFAAYLKEVAA